MEDEKLLNEQEQEFSKKNFFVFSQRKLAGLSYEVRHLHYKWFLQNLEKDLIKTNMQTTVCLNFVFLWKSADQLNFVINFR